MSQDYVVRIPKHLRKDKFISVVLAFNSRKNLYTEQAVFGENTSIDEIQKKKTYLERYYYGEDGFVRVLKIDRKEVPNEPRQE
jgi:hypothetical protein